MSPRDIIIINKVFPQQLKSMMMLISTESNILEKTKKLLQKSVKTSILDNEKVPFDVRLMIELLLREIIIPDPSNNEMIKSPVFFVLSRTMQHNILLFLNFVISGSSHTSPFSTNTSSSNLYTDILNDWTSFLNNNISKLDDWGKFFLRMNGHTLCKKDIKEKEKEQGSCISYLCNDSKQRLQRIADKVKCKRFDVTMSHIKPSDSGRDVAEHSDIELDDNSLLPGQMETTESPNCEVTSGDIQETSCFQSSQKNCFSASYISSEKDDLSTKECSKQGFCNLFHEDISLLKETLFSLKADEQLPSSFYKFFNDCPNQEISTLCIKLELVMLPEESLCTFVSNICSQNELAFETSSVILDHSLTEHLNMLKVPISRNVFTCIGDTLKVNPRLMVIGVLIKLLRNDCFSSFQEDILKKLVANEYLKSDGVGLLLDKYFEDGSTALSEEFVSMIEVLLNTKPNLSENCLQNILKSIANNSAVLSKSLKLMKLLIMLIKTYPVYSSGDKILLQKIVNQNTTFMKKTALNLIGNLP